MLIDGVVKLNGAPEILVSAAGDVAIFYQNQVSITFYIWTNLLPLFSPSADTTNLQRGSPRPQYITLAPHFRQTYTPSPHLGLGTTPSPNAPMRYSPASSSIEGFHWLNVPALFLAARSGTLVQDQHVVYHAACGFRCDQTSGIEKGLAQSTFYVSKDGGVAKISILAAPVQSAREACSSAAQNSVDLWVRTIDVNVQLEPRQLEFCGDAAALLVVGTESPGYDDRIHLFEY